MAEPAAEVADGGEVEHTEAFVLSRQVDGTLRRMDPATGALELYTSIEGILKAVPKISWDVAATWSRLAIFQARLFLDKQSYERNGIARSYADKVFPDGVDLISAVSWWRRRLRSDCKGFVVFEGGFDTSGPIAATDAPQLMIDGVTGEVQAEDQAAIEKKRELHLKRRRLDDRWAAKGISNEAREKIKNADVNRMDRKAKGQEYIYQKGWVNTSALSHGAKLQLASPRWLVRAQEAKQQAALKDQSSEEIEQLPLVTWPRI